MEQIVDTDKGTFVIRPYRDEDEDKVLALWALAFGREMPRERWRWKYIENPFGYRTLICVDAANTVATVVYSGIPYLANFEGRAVRMGQVMDVMSHPDYRKTGLFVKAAAAYLELFGYAADDTPLLYGFPGEYHFEIGKKYLGYTRLDREIAYFVADTKALRRRRSWFSGHLEEVPRADDEFDLLWERLRDDYPLAIIRSSEFLNWRFSAHPDNDYLIYTYRSRRAGELAGYAIVGLSESTARVVDLCFPPDRRMVRDAMGRLAGAVAAHGAARLETWLPSSHFLAAAVARIGFDRKHEPLGIIAGAIPFAYELSLESISERLFYTMADADLF